MFGAGGRGQARAQEANRPRDRTRGSHKRKREALNDNAQEKRVNQMPRL